MKLQSHLAALLMAAACATTLHAEPLPAGSSQRSVSINGEIIELHTYKPSQYADGPILLVLHGLGANASGYRDYAIPLADARGFLVVAPLFDRKRFPVWRYQTGGIVRNQRAEGEFAVEPEAQWMGRTFLAIINAVRTAENRPDLSYSLIGHSAGGQTLSRFAAFVPHQARHIIIANPSTYLWPSREERFPFGFGGLPGKMVDDTALQRYLAQPVTLLLGTADNQRGGDLNVTAGAERQGSNRLERGHNAYRAAQQLARDRGWAFNWRLVEVPDVGHSARRMFGSAEALTTLPAY
ncbi:MAG: alpha/beta hydrolase [Burkholderiales bacterium]|jgi:poly(3-hydroxybutyrate) depolymerase|nr:alpha/beta hydrolase [Burkholderiales bacterium]